MSNSFREIERTDFWEESRSDQEAGTAVLRVKRCSSKRLLRKAGLANHAGAKFVVAMWKTRLSLRISRLTISIKMMEMDAFRTIAFFLTSLVSTTLLGRNKNTWIFFFFLNTGTMIPKSGGDYAYINDAFGPLPAFLYLYVALFVLVPTGNAITALTFAQYILQPVWHGCVPPYAAVRLLAAVITCKLSHVRTPLELQRPFSSNRKFAKLLNVYRAHDSK